MTRPDERTTIERRFDRVTQVVRQRLARNQRIRRRLPGRGLVRIDRQLPFLCIYRIPQRDDPGTRELVTTEASFVIAPGDPRYHTGVSRLVQAITETLQEHFGVVLLIELWSPTEQPAGSTTNLQPRFTVVSSEPESLPTTIDTLRTALGRIRIARNTAEVTVRDEPAVAPHGMAPIVSVDELPACVLLGLECHPVYREPGSTALYPLVLQILRKQLSRALRRGIARFTGVRSSTAVHFESLGPSVLSPVAKEVDRELGRLAASFDFLLQVTPTNAESAWSEFRESRYREAPVLHYRPLPYHPVLLKRRLFNVRIERVKDPTLSYLFWERQSELDRQLTSLRDRDTPDFLHTSLQLYGSPDASVLDLARTMLVESAVGPADQDDECHTDCLDHDAVVARAQKEIDHYRRNEPGFEARVETSDQIASGMMVSRNRLLVSPNVSIRRSRLAALLHHEVGTHLLTYFNGRQQPIRQLATGLAGYEELQEGLAVLAELLGGGLSVARLRTLAGRTIAVDALIRGSSFPETFALLHEQYQFPPKLAFVTTLRVHRAGGMVKDMIYLRGLRDVLAHLARDHDIEPLYIGKISLKHLPAVRELRRRGIVKPAGLLPRFWRDPDFQSRIEACRQVSIPELLRPSSCGSDSSSTT